MSEMYNQDSIQDKMNQIVKLCLEIRDEQAIRTESPDTMSNRLANMGAVLGVIKVSLAKEMSSTEAVDKKEALVELETWAEACIVIHFPQYKETDEDGAIHFKFPPYKPKP